MTRTTWGWLVLLLGTRVLFAAESSPTAFAFGLPVETTGPAAAYRLIIPAAVYRGTYRADLGDIRVLNGDGEVVASSLQRNSGARLHVDPVRLPLFPIPIGSHAVAGGLHVTIESGGSGVDLRAQSAEAYGAPISQYILDGRQVAAPVSAMQLDWPETDVAYSGHIRLDASDDLGNWRTVLADAPIANLRANGQAILQNRIVLPPTVSQYWRLSWLGRVPLFNLTDVSVQPAEEVAPAKRSSVTVAPTHEGDDPQDFWFDLAGHAPVDQLNLLLSEANTVATVEMSSRSRVEDPWRPVFRSQFFRLVADDGDHQNAPIEITVNRDRYWHAHVTSNGSLPAVPFRLQAEWIPEEITFLARGHGPFLLVYGNAAANDISSDLGDLPADIRVDAATTGAEQILGGLSRLVPPAAPFPRMRVALWSTLIAAVVALAWMAYRLSKEK